MLFLQSKPLLSWITIFLLISGTLLFLFWEMVFGAIDPNLQIDPSKAPAPLCTWQVYASPRWDGSQSSCYSRVGSPIEYDSGYLILRYGGVPASGYSPEYCYMQHLSLNPIKLGSRGDSYCPPLDPLVRFTASSDRVVSDGKFTINWTAATAASCALSGKAPETGNFSETFNGDVSWIRGSRTYDFVKRGIYTFQFACNGYLDNSKSTTQGTIGRNLTIYVGNIPPSPTVTMKIDPPSIKKGESATLSWSSENATALSINQNIGVVRPQGSIKISPSATTRYTITGVGEFPELGLARKSVTLRVSISGAVDGGGGDVPIDVPPDVPPEKPKEEVGQTVDLKINGQDGPITLGAPASLTLSWNLDNYCVKYGSWIGISRKAGEERRTEIRPGTYKYKLYCPLVGSDEVVVNVAGVGGSAVPLPVAEASISLDGKDFSRSIRVIRGEPVKIWLGAAYDADGDKRISRDDTGRWTSAMSLGGRCEWNSDLNQGTPIFDGRVPDPQNPEECTVYLGELTFFDRPGIYRYGALRLVQNDGKISNISYINIAVNDPPLPTSAPIIDLKINKQDGPVTLGAPAEYDVSWDVKNADTCQASGAWSGEKFSVGSQHFVASEKKELTYTLTCVGKLGTTAKGISLKVAELPVCDFSAQPTVLSRSSFERQSELRWKCQFANSCAIGPGVDINGVTFGSTRVSPSVTTKYTLTCQNLDGNSSFDEVVEVR